MASWRGTAAAGAVVVALIASSAGCTSNADAPTSHPTEDTAITATVGERFTLTVTENASTRSHWYLTDPEPDSAVVRTRGRHTESTSDDERIAGEDSRLTFTFEATGKGTTEIVLTHCTLSTTCDTGEAEAAPTPATGAPTLSAPERLTYTVTVG
ncbi:protease inhibitor I42 family protein [Streptomyces griseus]|uniref:protease inhibitor I42 family protein n=1 Tax=Streptomyces griseus TaxID=1911 RepID=UPI00068C87A7|nr:protease inhibitor I42 family protein [Streptomyces griseus]